MPVCPKCGRTFKAQGMPMHIAACKAQAQPKHEAEPSLVEELLDKMQERSNELGAAIADLRRKLEMLESEEKVLARVLTAIKDSQ